LYAVPLTEWNHRPLESALRQRVEELQAILDDCALLAHRVKMQCYSCECYEEGDCHTDCVSDYARKIYDDLSALRKPKKTSMNPLQSKIDKLEQEKAELVEACKDVILSAEYSDKVADFVSSCELGEAINRMRAALHKAEGKE